MLSWKGNPAKAFSEGLKAHLLSGWVILVSFGSWSILRKKAAPIMDEAKALV